MITIRTYKTKQSINNAAILANKHRLYVDGWCMRGWYKNPDNIQYIVLLWKDGHLCGSFVRLTDEYAKYSNHNCGTFISPDYRSKGLGRSIITHASKIKQSKLRWEAGIFGSNIFYKKTIDKLQKNEE